MGAYGYYLEVAGWDWLPATHEDACDSMSRGDTQAVILPDETWAQEVSSDPFTGESETGGISLQMLDDGDLAGRLTMNDNSPITRLTQDHTRAVATLTVADTTDFDASGYVWVGGECVSYSGKTGTTFTGCGRGAYQTVAEAHNAFPDADGGLYPQVTGFCPTWNGRRCWLYRYEIPFTGGAPTQDMVASGEIEGMEWSSGGGGARVLTVKIVSMWRKLTARKALSVPFAAGKTYLELPAGQTYIDVRLDDPGTPFLDGTVAGQLYYGGRRWAVVGTDEGAELISYDKVVAPSDTSPATVVGVLGGTTLNYSSAGAPFQVGDVISVATTPAQEQAIAAINLGVPSLRLKDSLNPTTAGGEAITVINRQRLQGIRRKEKGTAAQAITEANTEIREVRLLEGTLSDLLLRVLLSRDGDASNNTQYDTLPPGWGLALDDSDDVDVASIESLYTRDSTRVYCAYEPIELGDMLRWLALTTVSAVYGSRGGKVTAAIIRQLYPGEYASTIDKTTTLDGGVPRAVPGRIVNQVVWPTDYPLLKQSGEALRVLKAQDPDSGHRQGWRALADLDDPGLSSTSNKIVTVADAYFGRFSVPSWVVTLEVGYNDGLNFTVGDRVSLTTPFLPDLTGATGVDDQVMFVGAVRPDDGAGRCALTLYTNSRGDNRNCLIAPAGVLTGSTPGTPGDVVLSAATDIGDQADINYWTAGDLVRLIDRSTLGGAVTVVTTTVTVVTTVTNTLTLATVPAWAAAGDFIEPDDYAAYNGTPNEALWYDIYGAWADNANEDLNGDPPYTWGT